MERKEGKDINRNKYGWYCADCKKNKVVAWQKKGYLKNKGRIEEYEK